MMAKKDVPELAKEERVAVAHGLGIDNARKELPLRTVLALTMQ